MQLSASTSDFVVFDDVLTSGGFHELQVKLRGLDYTRHSTTVVNPEWRLEDGRQLMGPRFGLQGDDAISSLSSEFSDALSEITLHDEVRRLIGDIGTDRSAVSAAAWVYPRGTTLTMHTDGRTVAGAYAFYLHDYWPIRWGGWLVVMHARDTDFDLAVSEERALAAHIPDYSLGDLIIPRPNRISILSAEARHLISRIDETAGENLRVSLSGGFYRDA